ncbi:restriction endonuclease subunit S [Escherichia coli]|uniref:restriction endonuclease subunit S n=1 Tax=Escherichia coli TaxID=562 RepID=UPI00102DC443|nr:restriction endonuclease subunit S [Escherichia coli]RZW37885.1 restriction endonuclease subunit S [Escherichia coli]RZX18988.1 restriction endonuclease subunit S [Escherichia coli]
MSELNYLEKLLDGVDVEWKLLGDASFFEIANNGRKPVKSSLRIAGKTPYYGANNIQDYVDGHTHDGEYVLIAEDGSASLERYSIQYVTGKFWANNHVHVVRGKTRVNSRFLFHYLHIVNFIPFLTGGVRAKLTKGQLIEISVPIPCPDNTEKSLAIQAEIVRILDKFTALTAELTAELTMRKKQYNYYRDQLLSFDDEQEKPIYLEKLLDGVDVEWKLLGDASFFEIANNGRKPVKSSLRIAGKTPYYGANNIQDYVDGHTHDGEYVLIAEDGSASLERYSIQYVTGKFWANNHVHVVRGKTRVNSRFLFHYLHIVNFIPFLTGGVRAKLTKGQLIEISVPIPCPDNTEKSLAIQAEIVRILDKFDTLTNSITEGLPREIELRQKQYEYYRDLLFSFPKPDSVTN